ncbi:MAG: hypothetical protein ABIU30_15580 [Ferruginibacter sp.]
MSFLLGSIYEHVWKYWVSSVAIHELAIAGYAYFFSDTFINTAQKIFRSGIHTVSVKPCRCNYNPLCKRFLRIGKMDTYRWNDPYRLWLYFE